MLLSVKRLIGLPVYTQSRQKLGRVIDINLDIDSHDVFQYVVGRGIVDKDLYLVRPIQVISITAEEMVVDDAVGKNLVASTEIKNIFSSQSLRNAATFSQE